MRYFYKRNRLLQWKNIILIFIFIGFLILLYLFISSLFSPEKKAERALELFYNYEQTGDFANSWELFHSFMKEKLEKNIYMQERTSMLKENFGVSSFEYSYSKVEELPKWRMSDEVPEILNVYHYTVTQSFSSKYGSFEIRQPVYVTMEGDEWVILWNYN
ncbi:hypothetical protein SAMN04487944_105100 [Gracilibacillus ureilyticus]|uniref:NTF2-like N-terminal transpeptidase domain-containing protein n=1 Tax=Gracilibacillus ureilyticus TaxID=531814 RepID=A0A1H9PPK2_9BACI|nr:hypothetical protein [Gracilibacillus ureilyticus]SER50276.1 hypothetical protein SAMN04487944_105100 [Gracilibacillus ureilyticus]